MKARAKKLLALSALVVVGVLAFLGWKTLFPSEPVYQGKPLSAWAQLHRSNKGSSRDRAAAAEAEAAIRQIGTMAFPSSSI